MGERGRGAAGAPPAQRRQWLLPAEPVPVRLMNTVWADRTRVHDDLVDTGDLTAWLRAVGFPGLPAATEAQLALARRIRDALRRMAAAVTDDDRTRAAATMRDDDAVTVLNAALDDVPRPALLVVDGRWRVERRTPRTVEEALGAVI